MKAILLDCETTNLVKNRTLKLDLQPSVIQYYCCLVNLKTGKVGKEFETLIKPPKPLPDTPAPGSKKTITEITGITNKDLESAPSFKKVAKQIFQMIEKAPVAIAHNMSFDSTVLDIEAERLGIKIAWPRRICTVEQSVFYKGYRLTLSKLYFELFGESFDNAHTAREDTKALVRCAVEMFKRGWI